MDIERNQNELIQYFVVNKDLNMSLGKIAAQVAHVCMLIALRDQDNIEFQQWKNSIMKKVILSGHEKDLKKLMALDFVIPIIDKGFTEIPPDSLTVIGFPIMTRIEANIYVRKFRLL